jgi:hypothetical protein
LAAPLAKPWVCVFLSPTGGHERANFATKDQAQQFAERHARAFISTDTPLEWVDTVDSSVLTTELGEYRVVDTCMQTGPAEHPIRQKTRIRPKRGRGPEQVTQFA